MVIELSIQEAEEKLKALTGNTYQITVSKWVRKSEIKKKYGIPESAFRIAMGLKKPFIRKDDPSLVNSPIRVKEKEFVSWYGKGNA